MSRKKLLLLGKNHHKNKTTNHLSYFFNFTTDVYNNFPIGVSRQEHYPESAIVEDMRRIFPYNENDPRSWKRSYNRTEEDCEEEESLFEDIVCYILYLIVGVL